MGVLKWCAAVLIVSMVGFSTAVAATAPPPLSMNVAQDGNQAPIIEPIPEQTCLPTDRLAIPLTISDPDGDEFEVAADVESGTVVSIDGVNEGELIVSCDVPGVESIRVSATDTVENRTSVVVTIEVLEPNVAPSMRPVPRQECEKESSISLALTISDPNLDDISVTVVSRNAAVATGEISSNDVLQIQCHQRGLTNLVIGMDDGHGAYAEEMVIVAVGQQQEEKTNGDGGQTDTILYVLIVGVLLIMAAGGYWVSRHD
jgi:hypothetical protein